MFGANPLLENPCGDWLMGFFDQMMSQEHRVEIPASYTNGSLQVHLDLEKETLALSGALQVLPVHLLVHPATNPGSLV